MLYKKSGVVQNFPAKRRPSMQNLFGSEPKGNQAGEKSVRTSWGTTVLGFVGSAVICWIVLGLVSPFLAGAWGWVWITNTWIRVGVTAVVALVAAFILTRIEGTIWGMYYVIIGYLLSLGLIVWIVLRLLRYV
jgi:hypothetical protein